MTAIGTPSNRSESAAPRIGPPSAGAIGPCEVCIRSRGGCCQTDGIYWCAMRATEMPGYRIVATTVGLTGYRRRSAIPADADVRERLVAWIAQHGSRAVEQVRRALSEEEGGK